MVWRFWMCLIVLWIELSQFLRNCFWLTRTSPYKPIASAWFERPSLVRVTIESLIFCLFSGLHNNIWDFQCGLGLLDPAVCAAFERIYNFKCIWYSWKKKNLGSTQLDTWSKHTCLPESTSDPFLIFVMMTDSSYLCMCLKEDLTVNKVDTSKYSW